MFMGEYSHSVDAKGRLIVPAKFREQLGDQFVVTKGVDGCLYVYSQEEWKRIETAGQLNRIIEMSIPKKLQVTGGHPAKRTYQAIRIELNRELDVLAQNLDAFIDLLDDGGRICIITFHSLEDRIVKNTFKKNQDPCTCPKDFPVCVCGKKSKGRIITRKPILPSEEELEQNTRSRSAKLRVFERQR